MEKRGVLDELIMPVALTDNTRKLWEVKDDGVCIDKERLSFRRGFYPI